MVKHFLKGSHTGHRIGHKSLQLVSKHNLVCMYKSNIKQLNDNRGHCNCGHCNCGHDNHGHNNRRHDNRGHNNRGPRKLCGRIAAKRAAAMAWLVVLCIKICTMGPKVRLAGHCPEGSPKKCTHNAKRCTYSSLAVAWRSSPETS